MESEKFEHIRQMPKVASMRRTVIFILIMSMILVFLPGCGKSAGKGSQELDLRIIDGAGTGSLILAGDQVYQIPTEGLSVFIADERGSLEDLQNGMKVTVEYKGSVEDGTPARIPGVRSISIPASRKNLSRTADGAFYDLCTLYLKVLDTLWYDNTTLNDDIEYISVDLSDAPGSLTTAERSAIVWAFASRHKAVPLELSINELMDTGYIHLSDLKWNNGLLFTISSGMSSSTVGTVSFEASKWRSGNGTVSYKNCISDAPENEAWTGFVIGSRTGS